MAENPVNSEFEGAAAGPHSETDVLHPNSTTHSRFLPIAQMGSLWHGRDSLKNLVILGDSYSSGYQDSVDTWPNHVASLLAPFAVEVHNFSMPGATAKHHLRSQTAWFFARLPRKGPEYESELVFLDSEETTYVLFIGINDCGTTKAYDLEPIIDVVFDNLHRLDVGARARNFIIVDVPPIDRSPGGSSFRAELKDRVETWNDLIHKQTASHASPGRGAQTPRSIFLFSSHAVLTDVLDNPVKYGFTENDIAQEGGGIWADELHVTSGVQKVIAEQFVRMVASNSSS
ncbi:hypothetical protein DEU56DRAFT_785188 [Suillus clintonianus]|uniref:uncharacterized protein n=1 Tax=Suillus clintonianus TaxID=1904413 RepID=UPI001B874E60|nr:uncharacterized protein DEU56DRAFT_785188 [Suillus clintonianus]KAG2147659.1 hypothetical protein DEU56DRAFT_785188 [Suillus clintonianus]